jgi:hypothetical protein
MRKLYMDELYLFILGDRDVVYKIAEYLDKESLSTYVVALDTEKLGYLLKVLPTLVNKKRVIIANIHDKLPSILDDISEKLRQLPVIVIDFCLNYRCNQSKAYYIHPVITTIKIVISRLRQLYREIEELKTKIAVPKNCLAKDGNTQNVVNVIKGFLHREGVENISIEIGKEVVIEVQVSGRFHGIEKHRKLRTRLSYMDLDGNCYHQIQLVSAMLSTIIVSMKTKLQSLNLDLVNTIGSDEGFYTYFLSRLITYGWDFDIEIKNMNSMTRFIT